MKTTASLLLPALALGLGACGFTKPNDGAEEARAQRERSLAQRLKAACSSQATYDRLKQVAFDEAIRIRNADPVNLDTLSTHSLVRIENPIVKSRDEKLDVTVCSGRFILQVPPGAERAFDGERQLAADIEYAAQAAADGSGLVYQIKGAEPIIYRLATFDLRSEAYRPAAAPRVAAAEPPESPPTATQASEPSEAPPRPTPAAKPTSAPTRTAAAPVSPPQRAAFASPSFRCRSGQSRSERMVCSSDRLAALDRQMSSHFYSALSRGSERQRAELRRTRDRFLGYRERCADEACVAQAYLDRMDEIRDIASGR
ncbi:hypothetical protein ACWPM1_13875 [Tsuneonella sp. HG249]